jgi:CARDB/Glycosyl hydrolase catalytic core
VRMVRDGVEWFGASASFTVPIDLGPRLPDVIVTSVSVSPPSPSPGQATTFTAVVRNQGSAATPPGVAVGVAYFVDGQYRTWGSVVTSLAPGASLTVTTQGGPWIATAGGHVLEALVDDVDRFVEENENNNSLSTSFEVGGLPPPRAGADLFGMNIDPANPAGRPSAAALRDLGARFVRIEWKASRGYSFYDAAITAYRAGGVKVLLLVDYSSVPGSPPSNAPDSAWRDYIARFVASVSEIAGHYGDGVDAWQIWNEPDLSFPGTGYDPGVPAPLFGVMLRDTTAAIRARSTRPVVTGGLASGDPSYLSRARAATGSLTVDAVGVHPYGQRAPDNWPNPSWGFGNMSDHFERYLAFGLPLWVTEIGTVDRSNQAAYLTNVYDLVNTRFAGRVTRVFWFCWSDGMVSPFGVVNGSGAPKPAYWSYRAVAPPD